jgi:hypothetical protein
MRVVRESGSNGGMMKKMDGPLQRQGLTSLLGKTILVNSK